MTTQPLWIYDKDENLQLVIVNLPGDYTQRLQSTGNRNLTQVAGSFIGTMEEVDTRQIPEDQDAPLVYTNGWLIEQLNGAVTLEFDVIATNPSAALIENDGRVVTRNVDGDYMEFIIRHIEDIDDNNGTIKSVKAEGGEYELIDEFLPEYVQASVDLETALTAVLQGTRWQVGECDNLLERPVDLRNVSVKNAVYQLLNIFGAEVKYRIERAGNRITNRYIDVYKRRGNNFGKRFEDGKDILSTNRTLDSAGIKTALYGRGASQENDSPRLTFSEVEWSRDNGDPVDKPLGQTWVGDPDALGRWGYKQGTRHRFGFYDGQEEDPAQLLLNTWNDLQKRIHLRDTYEIEVIQLAELLGYDHEEVRLGDTCYAINRRIYPEVVTENNVIEYRLNLNDRKLSEVTLGQFRATFDVSGRLRDTEKTVNENKGNWDKKETPEGAREKAESEAQKAIDEAQSRIDDAKKDIEDTIDAIEQTKIDLEDAEAAIENAISRPQDYEGHFSGDIAAQSITLWDQVISQNATFTGEVQGSSLTFLKGRFEEVDIIDADIQNATITGQLDSVDGTFVGDLIGARITSNSSIDVTTDLYVGDNIYLGESNNNPKTIRFNQGVYIASDGTVADEIRVEATAFNFGSYYGIYGGIKQTTGYNSSPVLSFSTDSNNYVSDIVLDRLSGDLQFHGDEFDFKGNVRSRQYYSDTGYFKFNDSNSMQITSSNIRLISGGELKQAFGSIPKVRLDPSGDGVVDDKTFGANNPASMQPVLTDYMIVNLSGETEIILNTDFLNFVSDYYVFADKNVEVLDQSEDRITVNGDGKHMIQVVGIQKGKEDVAGYRIVDENQGIMAMSASTEDRPISRTFEPKLRGEVSQ